MTGDAVDVELEVRQHIELALKHLEEGRALIDRDPVQASEKLYKAAEEVVKALTIHYNMNDIIEKVTERGRWTATELDKAARRIAGKLGAWFLSSWDSAWTLHVWGFHEAKLDSEAVRDRLPHVERMILEADRISRY